MGEICLTGLNIALSRVLSVEEEQLSIRYRVLADQITAVKKVPLRTSPTAILELPHRQSRPGRRATLAVGRAGRPGDRVTRPGRNARDAICASARGCGRCSTADPSGTG
jgi:hypothetical protein